MKIEDKIDVWIANADIDIMYGIKRTRDESTRLKNSMSHEDLMAIKEAMKDE